MSKDNNNLRLLGSPVNLSYRSKKKEEKKNVRNRPRSALQNSCFTPDLQEGYKRPFSADAKERAPSTRNFLKAFSAELLQSYNQSPTVVKIVAPTTDLLGGPKSSDKQSVGRDANICNDNVSDYGSEDTFISLGTKIKAKAQSAPKSPKSKASNQKNFLKYRSIARKGRKSMDNNINDDKNANDNCGFEIKITEKPQRSPSPPKNEYSQEKYSSPYKNKCYESYFVPLNDCKNVDEDALAGRVSFGTNNIHSEVDSLIDKYSRRLNLTKQQLSLVEEESTQELESVQSQNLNGLARQNILQEDKKDEDTEENETGRNTSMFDPNDDKTYPKLTQNFIDDTRTYMSFYDDFRSNPTAGYKSKLSSTILNTDSSSKDSGYPDSGQNDDKPYKRDYSLPTTSIMKKSYSYNKIDDQPKSLDSTSSSGNEKSYHKTFPFHKKYSEPLNHSRLLYKDFFLKKEGDSPLPPNNSPVKRETECVPGANENDKVNVDAKKNREYPSYLLNSSTKAYTSKVIEDYKKELEAINCLHELTLKDIKTDAVSPTPLNIDKMFEQNSATFSEVKTNSNKNSEGTLSSDGENSNKSVGKPVDSKKVDVTSITTKEIIQNYLKVKEGDYGSEYLYKALKKYEKKGNCSNLTNDQSWNNKAKVNSTKINIPVSVRNQTKSLYTMRTPMSARIDGVENDKDIDSWMSLSAPSPRILEYDNPNSEIRKSTPIAEVIDETKTEDIIDIALSPSPPVSTENKESKAVELHEKSTVLDIYSMLKEIESFGEKPVTAVSNVVSDVTPETPKAVAEDRSSTPKENFLEIFEFLEKVEQSANDALSIVTNTTPPTVPKLEVLLKLPQIELAQRLVTASLQLEERSCCIALLQESLANHKEQMINKVSNLEKQSLRNVSRVKKECEEAIKRHQSFIDQLINDKKTLNHRIEQLVDERRALEERWKRAAAALEERYKLELRNQHDKMASKHQLSRQRWVREKAEKIKELTVKGLEGELREMAERQQQEMADVKMSHAEQLGRMQAKHAQDMELLRTRMEEEKEAALLKERQLASSRLEKQILELEVTYQEQRTRLVGDMRAEAERRASGLGQRQQEARELLEKWREEQEKILEDKRITLESEVAKEKENIEQLLNEKRKELELELEKYKKEFEAEQQMALKKKVTEIAAQHKVERDREIERAIESMEAEAQAGRRELQDALKRNKEQYEIELKELGETEQATLRRYQEAQARVRQTEDRCAEMEVMISQLETRNRVLTEKNSQLEQRADEIRSSCEETWRGRLEDVQKEMQDVKRTHEEHMHQLYAKVKVAVARKDSAIQAMTREAGKYQEKITLLEQKLQQQRKDFLSKK